ncbi:YqcC family protein [Vibrio sp. MA40-2]|uniref:YqcC family protein n=1 Tax=Vibrio sp. MA40-2 TaxID=3391828 RepID=UPI0039A6B431
MVARINLMMDDFPLIILLQDVETCLRDLCLWDDEAPDESALQSKMPFALDTLQPEQWLQWVFIPKMRDLLEMDQVPYGFSISPYFEQVWQSEKDKSGLILLLNKIDQECL